MNLTNLTPEQTLEVLGLVHYAENNTETQKEHNYKQLYPTLLSKFEWIDELQNCSKIETVLKVQCHEIFQHKLLT